jgi:monofunctional biosynthetic peptidoglycan transglycosylase
LRGVAWLVLGLVGAWVGVVLLLTLLYTVVPPVSTLMVGRWLTLQGVERTAVTLDEISPSLPRAVISSEDGRYCQHGGVDWDALRQVIEEADEDGPSRGASTIPMQLAKNLFLWPGRSYLRKGMEIPLALLIDLAWSKRRLLENYLNIVELGEGVFGAEAAARRYFGKRARDLSPSEAALLAAALPNPTLRNPGRPSARHRGLAGRLQRRMEFAAAATGCLRAAALPAGASQHGARPV